MNVQVKVDPEYSGAAGAQTFPGSDSRKFNYYEPKGRKATLYEDVTVDVQPDPERYLVQNWIIAFPNGDSTYSKHWTKAQSSNWHQFRAVDQEWERTHYQRQATIVGMIENVIQNGRRAGAPSHIDKLWVKVLQDHLGAFKHLEYGLGVALMHAQRYGYTQMVNNALLTNCSYKLRMSQDITLYLGELGLDLPEFDHTAGRKHWLEDEIWQKTRAVVEGVMGASDYIEQYFAANVVVEPLLGELFRSGFIMQSAAGQGDFMTPSIIAAAEGDYERNLANTVELLNILANDPNYGNANRALFADWLQDHGSKALEAARQLQPIWSLPTHKRIQFNDAVEAQLARVRSITQEIGIASLANN